MTPWPGARRGAEIVLVFDTSCYLNGQHDHLPLAVFPTVWSLVGDAITDGRIIVPREVYRELMAQDDDVAAWIRTFVDSVVEPGEEVQRSAGRFLAEFPAGTRNAADPFVLAEAQVRGFTVSTYEGRSFSGRPTRRWHRSMPGICQHLGVPRVAHCPRRSLGWGHRSERATLHGCTLVIVRRSGALLLAQSSSPGDTSGLATFQKRWLVLLSPLRAVHVPMRGLDKCDRPTAPACRPERRRDRPRPWPPLPQGKRARLLRPKERWDPVGRRRALPALRGRSSAPRVPCFGELNLRGREGGWTSASMPRSLDVRGLRG